jgi:hypothetical protein
MATREVEGEYWVWVGRSLQDQQQNSQANSIAKAKT